MSREKYALDVGRSDFQRMTLLGNIYMEHNTRFILNCGLSKGLHVADVGCGPGNMSLWLAEKLGEAGTVTAIDNSEEQLIILREQLVKHKTSNVSCKKLDIYDLSSQFDQQFDLVYCRFLMVHLQDPLKAITELKKILKPKGRLIISELDNATWYSYPASEALQKDINLLCETGKLRAIDLEIGKKLYSFFGKNHFSNIKVDIAQPVLNARDREYLIAKIQSWGKKYLEHNLVTKEELEDLLDNIKDLVSNEEYLLAGARMFQVVGTKV